MSGSDNGDSRPTDNSGDAVPTVNIHPKLMTNRNNSSNPTSARQQTPRSARSDGATAAPTNAALTEAGVSAEEGVVRQLSARKTENGSLAAPREATGDVSGRRAPPAIAAGSGIGEPLQLSEARQRRGEGAATAHAAAAAAAAPSQPAVRHAPYAGNSRASFGTSREPIRPGRSARNSNAAGGGNSPYRSSSKHNDPYSHVTSVVHEYRNNHISALEAQYRSVRSHSNAPASQAREHGEYRSASRQLQQQQQQGEHEVHTPRSARQDSPQPRPTAADYLRHGVPRAALDAPHIKYAEALENMQHHQQQYQQQQQQRHSPRPVRVYSASASTTPTSAFLPQVAQFIPDRFKYVEPFDDEKKRRKEETMRLLQDWRERQTARSAYIAKERVASPSKPGAAATTTTKGKRSASKNRTRGRSQPRVAEKAVPAEKAAAAEEEEEKPVWDSTFKPGFGTPPRSPRAASRTPRSARSGRKSGAASRALSRNGRKSRGVTPPATTRGEVTANPNAFRRRLLFDITAPTLSVV